VEDVLVRPAAGGESCKAGFFFNFQESSPGGKKRFPFFLPNGIIGTEVVNSNKKRNRERKR